MSLTLSSWTKPTYWPVVGNLIRHFCESPAENGCFGLILLALSSLVWVITQGFLVQPSLAIVLGGGLFLWGLAHIVICAMMITLKGFKIEQNRKMHEKSQLAQKQLR